MKQGKTLAERINYALDKQGMSQADLARATGLSTGIVAQIASGYTKDPRLSNVIKIAEGLHVPVDYLAGNVDYCIIGLGGDGR